MIEVKRLELEIEVAAAYRAALNLGTLYLEVADRKLRVKAGAWYKNVDARAATVHLIELLRRVHAAWRSIAW